MSVTSEMKDGGGGGGGAVVVVAGWGAWSG